jgi:hypothetical protein
LEVVLVLLDWEALVLEPQVLLLVVAWVQQGVLVLELLEVLPQGGLALVLLAWVH